MWSQMRYRFFASPEALDEVTILRLARGPMLRGCLGISPITAASTNFSGGTSHPTKALNHPTNVSRTMARYSGVADETEVTSTPCYSR